MFYSSIQLSEQYKTRYERDSVFFGDLIHSYVGIVDENIKFIEKVQLEDEQLWQTISSFYGTNLDDEDDGWRCEYWGKIMRGACWTYSYRKSDKLYNILTKTVQDLLKRQDEHGRFSTYSIENEFHGWDMWGRKYVMLGLLHYYDICKDESLKKDVVCALKKHGDYIIDRIGEGKKNILETSHTWGCINSASILEPFVRLYNLTGEKRYFDFSSYIVSTGFCADFNLLEEAYRDEKFPYEYPVVKAYEMMSCFEGLLEYWRISGEEKHLESVKRFADRVIESEITVIGCAGCYGEYFDNARYTQSGDKTFETMQETCVTVTLMKLMSQLYCITGDIKYIEEIEKAAYNAMPGSVNTEMASVEGVKFPFDSYSPLVIDKRGSGVGGHKCVGEFSYGCCAAIGAAGLALIPMCSMMKTKQGFVYNVYIGGATEIGDENQKIKITTDVGRVDEGRIKIGISCENPVEFELKLRIPYYANDAKVIVNGESNKAESKTYYTVKKVFENDVIEIVYTPKLEMIEALVPEHKRVAFKYGPYVLARDLRFCVDTGKKIHFNPENLNVEIIENDNNKYQFKALITDGKRTVAEMIDYASAGKTLSDESLTEAWISVE